MRFVKKEDYELQSGLGEVSVTKHNTMALKYKIRHASLSCGVVTIQFSCALLAGPRKMGRCLIM